jgi:hypothetical protein
VAAVPLSAEPSAAGDVAIACTLGAGEVPQRIADWQDALRDVTAREPVDGGVRLHLPRHAPVAGLAALIEAEQRCCRFFTFALTVGVDAIVLDVTAPAGAEDVVHALVGAPAGPARPRRPQAARRNGG